jgi:uncharacterized membrane protein YkgB
MKNLFSSKNLSWYLISFCYIVLTYLGASKMALTDDNIEFFNTTNLLNFATLVGMTQFLIALGFLFQFLDKYIIVLSTLFLLSEVVLRLTFMDGQGIFIPSVMIVLTWVAVISRKHFTK